MADGGNQQEAHAWTPRLRLVGSGDESTPRRTLRWVFEERYLPTMSVEVGPAHIEQLRLTLRRWEDFCVAVRHSDAEIESIRPAMLMEFRTWRREQVWRGKPIGPATVNKDLRNIQALLNCAYWHEDLERPVRTKPLPEPRDPTTCWSVEEFSRLLAVAQQQTGHICGVPRGLWWWTLLSGIWDTGRRRGTMLAAEFGWLDDPWMWFPSNAQKERRGQGVKLSRDTLVALEAIREPARRLIWPTGIADPNVPVRWLRELISAAGLAQPAKPFHILRACHATYVAKATTIEQARESLGHSSVGVTRRYIDQSKQDATNGCDLMPRGESMRFADPQRWLF